MDRLLTRLDEGTLHVHERLGVWMFPQGLAYCVLNGRKGPPRIAPVSIKLI